MEIKIGQPVRLKKPMYIQYRMMFAESGVVRRISIEPNGTALIGLEIANCDWVQWVTADQIKVEEETYGQGDVYR